MLESLIASYGYLAIFIGTLLEGETILVLGGFAAHHHMLWLPGVMLAAFAGSIASDQVFFYLGRRHGERLLARRPAWQPAIARVRGLLDRRATLVILSFRFLYGLRNVTPFALGMSHVSTARFTVLNAIGAAVWAVTIALLGWAIGAAAKQMIGHVERYERSVMAAIVVVGVLLWLWHTVRARRAAPRS